MITCCKDCVAPKRHVGCHSTCPDYISAKALDDERKKKRRADQEIIGYMCDKFAKLNTNKRRKG